MKKLNVTPKNISTFISIIIFAIIMSLVLACATRPAIKKVWTKPNFTQQEWATDKYACLQQSQQNYAYSEGGYYIGNVYFPPEAKSKVITNWELFNACMESRGWRLVEERQQ